MNTENPIIGVKSHKNHTKFIAFCSTNVFKKLVKDAVNDEIFWGHIIQQLSLSNLVQNELNTKLPIYEKSTKDKVKILVNEMITKSLNDFSQHQIPSSVA